MSVRGDGEVARCVNPGAVSQWSRPGHWAAWWKAGSYWGLSGVGSGMKPDCRKPPSMGMAAPLM